MKIALVAQHSVPDTPTADPFASDEAAHVSGLGRALAAHGHDVVIYARQDAPDRSRRSRLAPGLAVEPISAGPKAPVPPDELLPYTKDIADCLAASWQTSPPDVVHAFHWTSGLAALSAAHEHPVPVVATVGPLGAPERHATERKSPRTHLRMAAGIARAVAAIVATTSDEVAEIRRLGSPTANVSLVPGGFDPKKFSPASHIAKRKRRTRRLLAVGSLAEHRDLETVLRCLADLPACELVIAGGPPADDLDADPRYHVLAKLAAKLGIADRARFVGQVTDKELAVLLRSADLLVSGARYEPQRLIAARAMACGVPIVATAVGSYRDAVIDGTTGLLVPPRYPQMLSKRLRELLASPMRLAAFGIAAADRAQARYAWRRIAAETVAVYETGARTKHGQEFAA